MLCAMELKNDPGFTTGLAIFWMIIWLEILKLPFSNETEKNRFNEKSRAEDCFRIPNEIQINFYFRSCFQKKTWGATNNQRWKTGVTMFMVTAVATMLTTLPFRIAFLPHLSSSVMPLIASKFLQVSWLKNGMLSQGRWSYLTKETSKLTIQLWWCWKFTFSHPDPARSFYC